MTGNKVTLADWGVWGFTGELLKIFFKEVKRKRLSKGELPHPPQFLWIFM